MGRVSTRTNKRYYAEEGHFRRRQTMRFIYPCLILLMASISFGQVLIWPIPDDQFVSSSDNFRLSRLSHSAIAVSTPTAIYLNADGKCTRWNAVYAERDGGIRDCVGGSKDRIYFTRDIFENRLSTKVSLESLAVGGGVEKVSLRPYGARFEFIDETHGLCIDRGSGPLRVTTDGGKTWREAMPTMPGQPARENVGIKRAIWASSTEIAVEADHNIIASLVITPDGSVHQKWAREFDSELLFASPDSGIWLSTGIATAVLKLDDGATAATYAQGSYPGTVVTGKRVFSPTLTGGVFVFDFTAKELKPVATVPIKAVEAITTFGQDDAVIAGPDGKMFSWQARNDQLQLLQLKVDNEAVRLALKPSSDQPTQQEMQCLAEAVMGLPQDIQTSIIKDADSHGDWTHRQKVLWITEQCKKHEAEKVPLKFPPLPSPPSTGPAY